MKNIPLISILIIFGVVGIYLAGKYNLLPRLVNFLKEKLLQITSKKIIAVVICGILVFIIISAIYNKIADYKAKKEGCQPFTPLLLQKYKIVSGKKPVLGEKCTLSSKSFLIKILYGDSKQAQSALTGLIAATVGERKTLADYPWVTYQGSSSIFLVDGQKVGVLLLLDEDKESRVKTELNKVLKDAWIKESGNLTYDSKTELTVSPMVATTSEIDEILAEAHYYVNMHTDQMDFNLKITKKLADYALVQVIPKEDTEGAAVVLEKIDNHWVAQEMGTTFPQWEERVPELFQF